jgi:hypothetical protein
MKKWTKEPVVRLGQVRKAIKSQKIEAILSPIHLLACFGQKFERTVFEKTTSSQNGFLKSSKVFWFELAISLQSIKLSESGQRPNRFQ